MANDYEVGYGKPPKATQFTKGQSGNPKGRPKGSLNLITLVHRQGRRKITITEGGRKKEVFMLEAIILQLTHQALSGDRHARQQYLSLLLRDDGLEQVDSAKANNDELRRDLLKRFLAGAQSIEDTAPQASDSIEEEILNVIP